MVLECPHKKTYEVNIVFMETLLVSATSRSEISQGHFKLE